VGAVTHQLVLPTSNPQARWGGSGGYWVGVDINDIDGVRELADSGGSSS